MRVAVITPYYKETPAVLRRMRDSVAAQTHPGVIHVMVADGHPQAMVDGWDVHHLRLPAAHGDNGNTPRGLGAKLAVEDLGAEAIAFLDADNWLEPDHLAGLVAALRASDGEDGAGAAGAAEVATARRCIRALDGSVLLPEGERRDGWSHHDTSAMLMRGRARLSWPLWLEMPRALSPICDTIYWYGLLYAGCRFVAVAAPTLNFQSHYMAHYIRAWGEGATVEPVLPSAPQRQALHARRAFDALPAADLAALYRRALAPLLPRETAGEAAALLRFGSALAGLDITMDAIPMLRAVDPARLSAADTLALAVNLGAALARQCHWRPALAPQAEAALRAALDGPAAGLVAGNLAHLLARLGRLEEACALLPLTGSPPAAVAGWTVAGWTVAGWTVAPLGDTPFRLLVQTPCGGVP